MASEPITLFARIADPAGVARRLRELHPTLALDGPDDDWRNAVVTLGSGRQKKTLTLMHDPAYYTGPDWAEQMNGMRGYFARFPRTDRQARVLMLTTTFCFSLGTLFEPDYVEGDPRLDILYAVAERVDGVLFTPSSLRDAHGRVLFGAGGEDDEDMDAVWPCVAGRVSLSEPAAAAAHEASRPTPPEADPGDPNAPAPTRVARRALALIAVTARAILEREALDQVPEAEPAYQDLLAWLQSIEAGNELEPEESEVLQQPLGRLDAQQHINAVWRLEGLGVLAWALDRFEVPPHDQLVDTNVLWTSLGWLDSTASQELVASASLRPRVEIGTLRNRLFALHWRLRNFTLDHKVLDFAEFARTCWFGPLDLTGLPLVGGDLAVAGQRLDQASADDVSAALSAALERHKAANWLWQGPERYSEASEDT